MTDPTPPPIASAAPLNPSGDARLTHLLQVVAVASNEAASVEEAIHTCLDAVCALTGWPLAHAYLADAEGVLHPTGIWHVDGPERFRIFQASTASRPLAPGDGLVGRVLSGGEPYWVEVGEDGRPLVRAGAAEAGIRAAIAFPIRVGARVAGALEFFSITPAPRDPALEAVMVSLGTQVGRVLERAQAEEALRLSEAKFAGIISISSDAIVSVDEAQRIIFFNQGAERTFGYPAGQVLGEPLETLIPEPFRADHADHVRGFGHTGVAARRMGERGQIWGLRANGEVFPADASISRLEVGGKRIYTAVLRDVTERVRAEEALARQAEELARSNAELEQFAYVASHDLQEPLRMVASYTQLLARRYRERLDDDALEFIGYAVEGVNRMQALIADLLAFSRVGSRGGRMELTDLNQVMARTLENLEAAIREASAEISVVPLPSLVVDPVQIGQLFQNLIGNAVKFRGEAPARVEVGAAREGSAWHFSVRDNGIGIEPEYAERIFVIFQRLHGRTEYPGTGIGLAICKKIVERHGGRIWVEAAPGGGSLFHFTLPQREGER
jgi:PAS domain S-box-containing protein